MSRPLYVYDNWSAYDELSDSIPLTEELAMREMAEVVRLRGQGVKIDAYLMDAFWYEKDGGYLTWKTERWPNGPGAWIEACRQHGILPGLWFPTNTAFELDPPPGWESSLAPDGWGYCCFEGGFMDGFVERLEHWYAEGIRVFKLDFAEFGAASAATQLRLLPSEIRTKNVEAYRRALVEFVSRHPDARFLGYNGFEEAEFMTWTDRPIRRVVDPRWLEAMETLYCGDPRPADLPMPDFWRALDIYADHMVRTMHDGGFELGSIDNCAFMIGIAGTCYGRGNAGWRSCLLLSLARGGKVHMTLGNLEALSDEDAQWFAAAQALYEASAPPRLLGGIPGKGEIYGYDAESVLTIVNPSLEIGTLRVRTGLQILFMEGHVDHSDGVLSLGPGAVAVLGSQGQPFLGASTRLFPAELKPIEVEWLRSDRHVSATLSPPFSGALHLGFQQFDRKGQAVRTSGGTGENGRPVSDFLKVCATQESRPLALNDVHARKVWSGLSWAYSVLDPKAFDPTMPVEVHFSTTAEFATMLAPFAATELPPHPREPVPDRS